jgi:transposase-like protein
MTKRRKTFGASEKAKVAIAAIKEDKPLRELASKFQVHGTQISVWKKTLLDRASELFERGRSGSREREAQQRESELYEEIGRLKMEIEWLKKKSAQFE